MKLLNKTLPFLSILLIRVGESATANRKTCWSFLKRESDLYIKELEYAVKSHSPDDESVLTRSQNSINAFKLMIEHALGREVVNCAHYNGFAYKLRERPILQNLNSVHGMDKFFANLGVELLSIMPFENLMEYSGIVDESIREDLSFLFSMAKKIGLATGAVKNLISILWMESGYEKFSTRIARIRNFYGERNVAELRIQLGLVDSRFSGKPGLARLDRATRMFGWMMDRDPATQLPYQFCERMFKNLNEFVLQSHRTNIPNDIIDSLTEMVERLHFLSPEGRSMIHRSAELIVARLKESLTADSSRFKSIIEELKPKLDLLVPLLRISIAERRKNVSPDLSVILNDLDHRFEEAGITIVPILLDFVKIYLNRAIKLHSDTSWNEPLRNLLEPVVRASIAIIQKGTQSLVALSDILFEMNSVLLTPISFYTIDKVGDAVLNAAFQFSLKYGVDLLGQFPNILPGDPLAGKLIELFVQIGEADWNVLLDQSVYNRAWASKRRFFYYSFHRWNKLQGVLEFLNSYILREQINREKGIFNDFPLLSPARFLREYVGMPSPDLVSDYITHKGNHGFTDKFLERHDYADLFVKQFHLFTDWDLEPRAHLPSLVLDQNIRPFLALEEANFFASFSRGLSEIYNHHGVSLDVEFPKLMLAARNLPSVLLRIFIQMHQTKQHMIRALVVLGNSFLELMRVAGKSASDSIKTYSAAKGTVFRLIKDYSFLHVANGFWEEKWRQENFGESCMKLIDSLVEPALTELASVKKLSSGP